MKAIKISLVIVVVAAIAFYSVKSIQKTEDVNEIAAIENDHVKRIENFIENIKTLPNNKFNKEMYAEGLALIDHLYKPAPPSFPYGRLGETQSENDFRKKTLSKNLYSVYVKKFIDQTFNFFSGSAWNYEDLKFIREESKTLSSSTYLSTGSPNFMKFREIQQILNKYDEINRFINEAKNLKTPDGASAPIAVKFPIEEVNSKINQSQTYLNSNLGNSYVNNCSRLKQELRDIPNILFQKHIHYLNKKLDYWTGTYSAGYRTLTAYRDNVYSPINNEINSLSNQTYNAPDFDSRRASLRSKWELEARSAWNHFNK